MLQADKTAVLSALKQQALQVQQKEVELYLHNLSTVSGQAAMLAGFSFGGLMVNYEGALDGHDHTALSVMYFSCTALAMGFLLLTVSQSAICMVYGPDLALRGQAAESMAIAVKILHKERAVIFWFFGLGLICFHISAILYCLIYMKWVSSGIVGFILLCFLFLFYYLGFDLYQKLRHTDTIVSGEMKVGSYSLTADRHVEGYQQVSISTAERAELLKQRQQNGEDQGVKRTSDEPAKAEKSSWW